MEDLSDTPSVTAQKVSTAKQKKDTADQAFKLGNTKDALKAYHEALMYLLGLDKNALQSIGMAAKPVDGSSGEGKDKERTEALAKNESNYKAMFRKGKALGEQGFFEKALKVLEDLKAKNPSDTSLVDTEIARLRAIDNERERVHKQKMKGFLNKAEKKGASISDDVEPVAIEAGFIEEVKE
ncbi:hypothetical protein NLJ89_g1718 [Agrocybe chaxingu]|uniref:TPR-like protein n=1 Tax=Agrocybe chaxingu TaxID=84603 RepID=A0A9W8MZH9_9AGAR|nr:hypothetical protein NLJ89_g1718 [Agrocybe chaxingu]